VAIDPRVHALIALQHSAGNRRVGRLLRKPVGAALGSVLGHAGPAGDPLRARSEYVPRGQRPGRFEGFMGEYAATVHARRQRTACVVVKDADARFHVLDTGRPAGSLAAATAAPRRTGGLTVVRWMNLSDEFDPLVWARKRGAAIDARQRLRSPPAFEKAPSRQAVEQVYVDLLAYTFGVEPGDIHVARSATDRVAGKINFDLDLASLGTTDPHMLPADRHAAVPEAALVIGPTGATQVASALVQGTLLHEEVHLRHNRRAIELWSRWARSARRRDFGQWLEDQPLTRAERELTLDLRATRRRKGGHDVWEALSTAGTEALGYAAKFMFAFHEVVPGTDAVKIALLDLSNPVPGGGGVAEYWINAQPAVQKLVLDQLGAYYRNALSDAHRRVLAAFVQRKRDEAARAVRSGYETRLYTALGEFYDKLLAATTRPRPKQSSPAGVR
jgi:hypothetical protein